ncbi:MAG: hypothetical protein JWM74_1973 [Myxococcaceae bacterium]|jgi:hypothetical protein|nr:hypothetical protein [Myxococcaceae bacterium]
MKDHDEDIDARLARLTNATRNVEPRRDFGARVARAIAEQGEGRAAVEPSWIDDAVRSARRLVPVAALAAVLGLVWAVQSDRAYDDAFASSYGDVETAW